ncbi:hypothetical protein HC928_16070 [bacterium]|nr:hypothetical protein [bacterium]
MFRQQPPVSPPEKEPEPSGFRFEIRLTEEALLRLLPWVASLLIGGGVVGAAWQVSQTPMPMPTPTAIPTEVNPQP